MANLDTAQLQALKTDITVTHASEVYEGKTLLQWWNDGNNQEISEWYALVASPQVLVWREDITRAEVNEAVLYTELLTLSIVDITVFQLMLASDGGFLNAASQNIRDGMQDVLSGPNRAQSRNNMIALAKRPASYGEALYTTAIDGAFISAIYGDRITHQNVADARPV